VIGAFLARGLDPLVGAALAAHVHGRAGARGKGEGLMAGDLPDLVAQVLTELGPTGRSDRSRPTNGVVRTLG
jgi:NAD(P)H-hydrate repair Nnr-like enzyme with NAD(P)H-hydrate dehydratase domain